MRRGSIQLHIVLIVVAVAVVILAFLGNILSVDGVLKSPDGDSDEEIQDPIKQKSLTPVPPGGQNPPPIINPCLCIQGTTISSPEISVPGACKDDATGQLVPGIKTCTLECKNVQKLCTPVPVPVDIPGYNGPGPTNNGDRYVEVGCTLRCPPGSTKIVQ